MDAVKEGSDMNIKSFEVKQDIMTATLNFVEDRFPDTLAIRGSRYRSIISPPGDDYTAWLKETRLCLAEDTMSNVGNVAGAEGEAKKHTG